MVIGVHFLTNLMCRKLFFPVILCVLAAACQPQEEPEIPAEKNQLYLGADLSYVNEVEDCGSVYREEGQVIDPYQLFSQKGANIIRLRLWHNPDWTTYSTYTDVVRSIKRAKAQGMQVLLDFHYSDTWADPGDQIIPKAWEQAGSTEILGDSLYNYTHKVLTDLAAQNLTPEFVQVGNETNSEILLPAHVDENSTPINWERNVYLLNRGIKAVKDVAAQTGDSIQTMLHIAQPENAFPWFTAAFDNGIADFDWIGLSYYPKWSSYPLSGLSEALKSLKSQYGKRVMVVETAYPYSFVNVDSANNILGEDAVIDGYPATPAGQRDFMIALTREVVDGGGEGLIYWEPAWISSPCSTRWGKGSHWENATFFDAANQNEALPAFDFYEQE